MTEIENLKGSLKYKEVREALGCCPVCNSNIKDRIVSIYGGLIRTLVDVYNHCAEKGNYEFDMKEVRDIMKKNEYARFGDLVRFGGLVYRPLGEDGKKQKGHYGLNKERIGAFLRGESQIPMQISINQVTNEARSIKMVYVHQVPELGTFLDEHGQYNSQLTLPVL